MDESSKQYTAFTVGNLGFFKCNCMPFGLYSAPATFQQLMQNCLRELNLIYCLIYLDDIVVFLQTTEEHLHCLHVIFNWFREHNLKLKPSKCNFFREEITYLAHWVSRDGVWPSNSNLKAITEWATSDLHQGVCLYWSGWPIQEVCMHCTATQWTFDWRRSQQKLEWVLLSEDALKTFESLKLAWMIAPIVAFNDYTSHSCWRLMFPRMDWGQCCCRSKQMDDTTVSPMAAEPLCLTRRTITQLSLCFLALKWAVTEHFKGTCPINLSWWGQITIHWPT